MNNGLDTGLNASDVVSHGVHAGLGGVDLDDIHELLFAAGQFVLPEDAVRFAFLHN